MTTCTICFQNITNECVYTNCNCNYVYHTKCLDAWLNKSLKCPTCRKQFKTYKKQIDKSKLDLINQALYYDSIGRYNYFQMNYLQV